VRPEVAALLATSDADRLREEDPHTDRFARSLGNHLVAVRSRFEVDLNRPRTGAVYLGPADAWGLAVWRRPPPAELLARSLADWDAFYRAAEGLLSGLIAREGRALVLDLHAYCHRRGGPAAPPADPASSPEVDLATGSLERGRWAPVVTALGRAFTAAGLDARENARFRGGHFVTWLNGRFPGRCCAIAVEFKKTFVDEWTGAPDPARLGRLEAALADATRAALAAFQTC